MVKSMEKAIVSRNILVPGIKDKLTVSVYVIWPEKFMIYGNNGQSSQCNRNGIYA